MTFGRPDGGFLGTIAALVIAGCSASRTAHHPGAQSPAIVAAPVHDPKYTVGPGDTLRVNDMQKVEVEGDGRIQLARLGSINVDGLTAADIQRQLEPMLGATRIRVEQCNSQFIYVICEAKGAQPTPIAFRGEETLRDALFRAGVQPCRAGYRVRLVRPAEDVGMPPRVLTRQLDDQLRDANPDDQPIQVQTNDYIYVEKNKGAGSWMTAVTSTPWIPSPKSLVPKSFRSSSK